MIKQEIIDRYRQLDTALISDAMEELRIPGGLLGISSILEDQTICGEAFTVHYIPAGLSKPAVGRYFSEVQPGQVIVIDNAGRLDCAVWGDITTRVSAKRKIEGTVIDGACRDIKAIRQSGFPVFAKGKSLVSGRRYVVVGAVNVPISCAGILVCPGDLVFGDETGVIVIPKSKIEVVLKLSEKLKAEEEELLSRILT